MVDESSNGQLSDIIGKLLFRQGQVQIILARMGYCSWNRTLADAEERPGQELVAGLGAILCTGRYRVAAPGEYCSLDILRICDRADATNSIRVHRSDYNRTRRHSANDFISPEVFEVLKVA